MQAALLCLAWPSLLCQQPAPLAETLRLCHGRLYMAQIFCASAAHLCHPTCAAGFQAQTWRAVQSCMFDARAIMSHSACSLTSSCHLASTDGWLQLSLHLCFPCSGTGLVGAPACGDVMKLQVSKENSCCCSLPFSCLPNHCVRAQSSGWHAANVPASICSIFDKIPASVSAYTC